ncbi:MAG: polyprenyl diphosphate synthase [Anaerolineaceae bacterium]|nr:polyprenyl diphosphate synthase [Anaerolineaceae bacterium]
MAKPQHFNKIPIHMGIILDGNGRWAKARGLERMEGHRKGFMLLKPVILACRARGIQYLTFYAFSTENWNRPRPEVDGLMEMMAFFFDHEVTELHAENIRLLHAGKLDEKVPEILKTKMANALELTKNNSSMTVILGFNYGGRDEIVRAVRKMLAGGTKSEEITEAALGAYMDNPTVPDPDLIVRTSGEHRTSNFLTWEAAYAEWAFPQILWPDFTEQVLDQVLEDYAGRERRFGGVTAK